MLSLHRGLGGDAARSWSEEASGAAEYRAVLRYALMQAMLKAASYILECLRCDLVNESADVRVLWITWVGKRGDAGVALLTYTGTTQARCA